MSELKIGDALIGSGNRPFVIAEMSGNHNQSLKRALSIVEAAAKSGAHAVKLQTYTADTMTLAVNEGEFFIDDENSLWKGQSLHHLYKQAYTPWEWHKPLFDYAERLGITIFSSPFDNTAVDLLEDLNAPAYKIASFEAVDLSLIKYVAQTGKPMIISTGMADAEEIQEAIDAAREGGCQELAILHCVSGYPAPAEDYNLRTMQDMQQRFNLVTGLSDHTLDNTTAITSVALGASIIEKHVTLDRNGGGPDDSFSLEPTELKALCGGAKTAWQCLGRVDYGRKSSEEGNVKFRRSLYVVKDINVGEIFTHKNVRSIRPGFGLAPKMIDLVIGNKASVSISEGSALKASMVDNYNG